MVEDGVVDDMVIAEVGDDTFVGDESSQQFALLLRVTQLNGRPLPVGGLQDEQCLRYYMRLLEWFLKK